MQKLADNISLVCQSPDMDSRAIDIVVTVPTFRRPEHLLRTLESLKAQQSSLQIAIIVMENEAEKREGALAAAPLFEDGTYRGAVIITHDRGNCNAYNGGWFAALKLFSSLKYICVIDDDELALPDWAHMLCQTMETHHVDLVGGPQIPVFEGDVNAKWTRHPVFTPHYADTGPVKTLYSSGNLAISRKVLDAMPQPFFDLQFNFTGGGDADFMRRAAAKGFSMGWCNEAPVHETIPAGRVTWEWIQKRALRNGELSARIEHRERRGQFAARWKTIGHTFVLLVAAPVRLLIDLLKTGSLLNALYPVHIALGRIMSEFGYANEQYRNPAD